MDVPGEGASVDGAILRVFFLSYCLFLEEKKEKRKKGLGSLWG